MIGEVKKPRRYTASSSEEKISKYIEENRRRDGFHLKSMGKISPVMFVSYSKKRLEFSSPKQLHSKKLRLYWKNIYHCELDTIAIAEPRPSGEHFIYTVKIRYLLTPESQRFELRYTVPADVYKLGRITIPLVEETAVSILNSDDYQNCKKEMLQKLEYYDFFRIFPFQSAGAPSEVVFSMISNTILYLKDISQYNNFIEKNSAFFDVHKSLRSHLLNRLKTLNLRYHSLLVRPFDYVTIAGSQFTLAYFVVARSSEEITNDDILYLDRIAHDFYQSLQGSLYKVKNCQGRILNLSVTGARIFFKHEMVNCISVSSEMSVVFSIVGVADISIAGEVVYIEQKKNGVIIGFVFRKSPFGSRLGKFLHETFQNHGLSIC
ncbi:MAG: PilZ domain-containing protein [Spirochaetes bacterium]|nr:PilZ domain-containing protein [Spirochaetota bacterium]MBN2772368.1 PilZ domain-containing protein [Spirochaetota bacterium]